MKRVVPGSPETSYLVHALRGTHLVKECACHRRWPGAKWPRWQGAAIALVTHGMKGVAEAREETTAEFGWALGRAAGAGLPAQGRPCQQSQEGPLEHHFQAMMAARRGRFAAVPFAVIADAAGTTVAEARITASAYLPGEPAPQGRGGPVEDERIESPLPGGMKRFDTLFPDLAREDACTVRAAFDGSDEAVEFVAREFYCTEPRCDCRRVILHFVDPRRKRVLASINYAFDPSKPPFEDEPQISLDPLNPQSDQSDLVLRAFERMIGAEPEHRERFLRHYRLWKSVVDDPRHADHRKVRSVHHDNPSFRPAFPVESFQRVTPKVGANAACPCGSGKKYKKCCRT